VVVLVVMRPRTPTGNPYMDVRGVSDSIRVYEEQLAQLSEGVDSLKAVLARAGVADRPGIRHRIEQTDSLLAETRQTLTYLFQVIDEPDSRWHTLRNLQYLFGRTGESQRALSFDTLELEPVPERFPWEL
jgi:hypothetical protein